MIKIPYLSSHNKEKYDGSFHDPLYSSSIPSTSNPTNFYDQEPANSGLDFVTFRVPSDRKRKLYIDFTTAYFIHCIFNPKSDESGKKLGKNQPNSWNNEVMLLAAISNSESDDSFKIDQVFLPSQYVTSVSCEIMSNSDKPKDMKEVPYNIPQILFDMASLNLKPHTLSCWIHLHPNSIGVSPSSTDKDTQLSKIFGEAKNDMNYGSGISIMIIGSEKFPFGPITCEVWYRASLPETMSKSKTVPVFIEELELVVDGCQDISLKEIEANASKLFNERVFVAKPKYYSSEYPKTDSYYTFPHKSYNNKLPSYSSYYDDEYPGTFDDFSSSNSLAELKNEILLSDEYPTLRELYSSLNNYFFSLPEMSHIYGYLFDSFIFETVPYLSSIENWETPIDTTHYFTDPSFLSPTDSDFCDITVQTFAGKLHLL